MDYEKPLTLIAMDENYDIITLVPYNDLQWNRKYHEAGFFSFNVRAGLYTKQWKYIYTAMRPEMGRITQVNWKKEHDGGSVITISGMFLENDVNKMCVYPRPSKYHSTNQDGASIKKMSYTPEWIVKESTADNVARDFYNAFKRIDFVNFDFGDEDNSTKKTHTYALDYEYAGADEGEYKIARHTRNGEPLGTKMYDILKPSLASYRVVVDYDTKEKSIRIIHATDHSFESDDPIVLSPNNGTLLSASVMLSDTNKKDVMLQYTDSADETVYVVANANANAEGRILAQTLGTSPTDYFNESTQDYTTADRQFLLDSMASVNSVLSEYKETINLQISLAKSSYRYMIDFDLGDMVSVDIPEIDMSIDAQIIACYETVNDGVWELSIELGTPIKIRR